MPAGIKIINDYGTILIDDTSPTLSLRKKVVATSSGNDYLGQVSLANAETPIVVIAPQVFSSALGQTMDGTTMTWSGRREFGYPVATSLTAYCFDRPAAPAASSYGLVIRDANGRVTFDALQKYACLAEVMTTNDTFYGKNGHAYAGLIVGSIFKDETIVDPVNSAYRIRRQWTTGIKTTSNQLIVAPYIFNQIRYPSSEEPRVWSDYGAPKVLVMDVTDY
jgi:hypothetical protein